ncbi:MAG: hypothetical protein RDV41_14620 [Planctomycetota bacterium]|nr:hypothetical protein [Planctomycetota bacterium]
MIPSDQLLLGQAAMQKGLLSRDQLDECIAVLKSSSPPKPLSRILVEKSTPGSDLEYTIGNPNNARLERWGLGRNPPAMAFNDGRSSNTNQDNSAFDGLLPKSLAKIKLALQLRHLIPKAQKSPF